MTPLYGYFPEICHHSPVVSRKSIWFCGHFPEFSPHFAGIYLHVYLFCWIFTIDLILLILLCYYFHICLLSSYSSFHPMYQPNLSIQSLSLLSSCYCHIQCDAFSSTLVSPLSTLSSLTCLSILIPCLIISPFSFDYLVKQVLAMLQMDALRFMGGNLAAMKRSVSS